MRKVVKNTTLGKKSILKNYCNTYYGNMTISPQPYID